MSGTLTKIGIENNRGTDAYTQTYEYSDGTQSRFHGSYQGFQEAYDDAAAWIMDNDAAGVTIENWTDDWTDEEVDEGLDCVLGTPLIAEVSE